MHLAESRQPKSHTLRERITPTFYHHNIFHNPHPHPHKERITPTFLSTVFDNQGYHILTNHSRTLSKKQLAKPINHEHRYTNITRQQKIASLYPCSNVAGQTHYAKHSNLDYKDQITKEINGVDGRTSRMRKCLEQMSNPIFGGYIWQPNILVNGKKVPQQPPILEKTIDQIVKIQINEPKFIEHAVVTHNRSQKVLKTSLKQQLPSSNQKEGLPQKGAPVIKVNPKHQNNLKKLKSSPKLCTHKH